MQKRGEKMAQQQKACDHPPFADLALDHLTVICPGDQPYLLADCLSVLHESNGGLYRGIAPETQEIALSWYLLFWEVRFDRFKRRVSRAEALSISWGHLS